MNWFAIKWCDLFHGGGQVKRDCYGRINWQCSKCGRWSMPVNGAVEKLLTDQYQPAPDVVLGLIKSLEHAQMAAEAEAKEVDERNAVIAGLRTQNQALAEALEELTDCGAEAWGEDRPCVQDGRAALAQAEGGGMTDADLRKHFDLKPCPNPSNSFSIGSLIGEWVWAEDCWSQLAQRRLQTFYFTLHRIDSAQGTKAYSLVIWKLKIIWGFV